MNNKERKEYIEDTRRLVDVGDYFDINQVIRLLDCVDELQAKLDAVPVQEIDAIVNGGFEWADHDNAFNAVKEWLKTTKAKN